MYNVFVLDILIALFLSVSFSIQFICDFSIFLVPSQRKHLQKHIYPCFNGNLISLENIIFVVIIAKEINDPSVT